jgi:tRNA threonylcarbamoyladenosine biosynthesis protein TsaB
MQLVIETAGPSCSVALLDNGGTIIAQTSESVGRGHAERLMPMIAALPYGGRADGILVDCGPGSFTGIRVGVAAARALGLGWAVPVHGYSSLALLAARHFAQHHAPNATITIAGGHGELFVQGFAAAPFAETSAVASLTPAAVSVMNAVVACDMASVCAGDVAWLNPAFTALAPRPIYGRAPDAKPMA